MQKRVRIHLKKSENVRVKTLGSGANYYFMQ